MGFDQLLAQYVAVKYQPVERRTYCPRCGESGSGFQDIPGKGLHCRYCGWDEGMKVPFIPRLPEGNNS